MTYSKQHIGNAIIENEASGKSGLAISVHIDTLGACTIALGNSMTIRTDEVGIDSLRSVLNAASVQLMVQRNNNEECSNKKNRLINPYDDWCADAGRSAHMRDEDWD